MILWCLRKQQRQIFRSRERISIRFFCQSFELRNLSASLLRSLLSYLSIRCLLISTRTGHISSNLCSLPQVGQLFSISLHLFHISTKAAPKDGSVQKENNTHDRRKLQRVDSNHQPSGYEPDELPIALLCDRYDIVDGAGNSKTGLSPAAPPIYHNTILLFIAVQFNEVDFQNEAT